jgi:hypothetical protein
MEKPAPTFKNSIKEKVTTIASKTLKPSLTYSQGPRASNLSRVSTKKIKVKTVFDVS